MQGATYPSFGSAPHGPNTSSTHIVLYRDTVKNKKLRDALVEVAEEAGATSGVDKSIGALLYEVAVKVSDA